MKRKNEKKKFTRKEVEKLFEEVINDLRNIHSNQKKKAFYIGQKKIGIIRYFLSIRLDGLEK